MHATPILLHLKKHGQLADRDIAAATGIPLTDVRASLADLKARGEIMGCSVTRFLEGNPVEMMLCRVSGTLPAVTPGRKPSSQRLQPNV